MFHLWILVVVVGAVAGPINRADNATARSRVDLTRTQLMTGSPSAFDKVPFPAYGPLDATVPTQVFEGTLAVSDPGTLGQWDIIRDDYGYGSDGRRKYLPPLKLEMVQETINGVSWLIPVDRSKIRTTNDLWEWIVMPGQVWQEAADDGDARAAIPVAVVQRNANCIFQGMLSFVFRGSGLISQVAYQFGGETCLYFKINLYGLLPAQYDPHTVPTRSATILGWQRELTGRIPRKPLAELDRDYAPIADHRILGSELDMQFVNMYGLVIDNTLYWSAPDTRLGPYPVPEQLVLPSYSIAKSALAGFVVLLLRQHYGTEAVNNALVSDYVPEIAGYPPSVRNRWAGVTLQHCLNMCTGNYNSIVYGTDEASLDGLPLPNFFTDLLHPNKLRHALRKFPRKTTPGTQFVYHSSDTYMVLQAALGFYRVRTGNPNAILQNYLDEYVWTPLGISPTFKLSMGTTYDELMDAYDPSNRLWGGWGLFGPVDDIAKLMQFANNAEGSIGSTQVLHKEGLRASLHLEPSDPGIVTTKPADYAVYYNNGVWAKQLLTHSQAPCSNGFVPYFSGYGGILWGLMPSKVNYFYVSSGGQTDDWDASGRHANAIRPAATC